MAITTDWTLEQFLALPETKPALEFWPDGTVTQKMSPSIEHSLLQLQVGKLLDALQAGRAMTELRTIFGRSALVPDVAFFVSAELPVTPRHGWLRYPEWSPTVAVEIASLHQDLDQLRDKCRFYIEQGSQLALLVLPEQRRIELFAPSSRQPVRYAAAETMRELVDVLGEAASSITAEAIFAALRLE
ncbi:MAG: Uma2 family endonuclease [Chloroflexi bacterium]|nr:Uma2 family endonuclease [Chloroflexota bacterium]